MTGLDSFEKVLAISTAIAGGLGTGAVIGIAIIRFLFKDWIAWRERVEAKLDKLQPEHIIKLEGLDPERLEEHYKRLHTMANTATELKLTVDRQDRQIMDHENRMRRLELPKGGL